MISEELQPPTGVADVSREVLLAETLRLAAVEDDAHLPRRHALPRREQAGVDGQLNDVLRLRASSKLRIDRFIAERAEFRAPIRSFQEIGVSAPATIGE